MALVDFIHTWEKKNCKRFNWGKGEKKCVGMEKQKKINSVRRMNGENESQLNFLLKFLSFDFFSSLE